MVILILKIECVRGVVPYIIFGVNESWYFISIVLFTF
jgi:hypothetical protein